MLTPEQSADIGWAADLLREYGYAITARSHSDASVRRQESISKLAYRLLMMRTDDEPADDYV